MTVGPLLRMSRTEVAVWAGLMAATLVSWFLGHEGEHDDASVATALVIVVAFVKIRFIGRHFMELRRAPLVLRVILDAYVVVICTTLVVIYAVT